MPVGGVHQLVGGLVDVVAPLLVVRDVLLVRVLVDRTGRDLRLLGRELLLALAQLAVAVHDLVDQLDVVLRRIGPVLRRPLLQLRVLLGLLVVVGLGRLACGDLLLLLLQLVLALVDLDPVLEHLLGPLRRVVIVGVLIVVIVVGLPSGVLVRWIARAEQRGLLLPRPRAFAPLALAQPLVVIGPIPRPAELLGRAAVRVEGEIELLSRGVDDALDVVLGHIGVGHVALIARRPERVAYEVPSPLTRVLAIAIFLGVGRAARPIVAVERRPHRLPGQVPIVAIVIPLVGVAGRPQGIEGLPVLGPLVVLVVVRSHREPAHTVLVARIVLDAPVGVPLGGVVRTVRALRLSVPGAVVGVVAILVTLRRRGLVVVGLLRRARAACRRGPIVPSRTVAIVRVACLGTLLVVGLAFCGRVLVRLLTAGPGIAGVLRVGRAAALRRLAAPVAIAGLGVVAPTVAPIAVGVGALVLLVVGAFRALLGVLVLALRLLLGLLFLLDVMVPVVTGVLVLGRVLLVGVVLVGLLLLVGVLLLGLLLRLLLVGGGFFLVGLLLGVVIRLVVAVIVGGVRVARVGIGVPVVATTTCGPDDTPLHQALLRGHHRNGDRSRRRCGSEERRPQPQHHDGAGQPQRPPQHSQDPVPQRQPQPNRGTSARGEARGLTVVSGSVPHVGPTSWERSINSRDPASSCGEWTSTVRTTSHMWEPRATNRRCSVATESSNGRSIFALRAHVATESATRAEWS
ncbi:hypothetical protein [Pseudonocardia sp. DLS-67]